MKTVPRTLLSIAAGAGAAALFFVILEASPLLTGIIAVAGFIGSFLSLAPTGLSLKMENIAREHGVSQKTLDEIFINGKKKIRKMKKYARRAQDDVIKEKIENISEIAKKIYKNFQEDPGDIKTARQFLNYYLDATVKIIEQYSQLSNAGTSPADQETLKRAEDVMGKIEKAFEVQLSKLYNDDMLDLETEISLLENTLKHDGLQIH